MPVLIAGAITPAYRSQNIGPILNNAETVYYVFALAEWNGNASGFQDSLPSSVGCWRSLDNGLTWAEMDSAGRPQLIRASNPTGAGFDSVPVSGEARTFIAVKHPTADEVWVVYLDNTLGNGYQGNYRVAVFDFTTNTWGAPSAQGPLVDLSPVNSFFGVNVYAPVGLVAGADFESTTGDLVLVFNQGVTFEWQIAFWTSLSQPYVVHFNGTSWGTATIVPGLTLPDQTPPAADAPSYTISAVVAGAGGRVHALIRFLNQNTGGNTDNINHYLAADGSGGMGAGLELIATNIVNSSQMDGSGILNISNPMQYLAATGDMMFVGIDNTTGDSYLWQAPEGASPAWASSLLPGPTITNLYNVWDVANISLLGYDGTNVVYREWTGGAVSAEGTFDAVTDAELFAGAHNGDPGGISTFAVIYTPPSMFTFTGGGLVNILLAGLSIIGVTITGGYVVPSLGGAVTLSGGATSASTPGSGGGIDLSLLKGREPWPPDFQYPNMYDCCLAKFGQLVRSHPLRDPSRCIIFHEHPDGTKMPHEAREFWETGSVVTPVYNPAVQVQVLQFRVPIGYSGLLYGITLQYTGTGFVEGSGDIVWRLRIGQAYARDLGNSLTTLGVVGQCFPLNDYIRLIEQQYVTVYVQVPNVSGSIQVGTSRIVATVQGWIHPQ